VVIRNKKGGGAEDGVNDNHLEDHTAALLFLLFGQECSTSRVLEDFTNTLSGSGRAFEIVSGVDLLSDSHTLKRNYCVSYGCAGHECFDHN
jgi:hypothetical protein